MRGDRTFMATHKDVTDDLSYEEFCERQSITLASIQARVNPVSGRPGIPSVDKVPQPDRGTIFGVHTSTIYSGTTSLCQAARREWAGRAERCRALDLEQRSRVSSGRMTNVRPATEIRGPPDRGSAEYEEKLFGSKAMWEELRRLRHEVMGYEVASAATGASASDAPMHQRAAERRRLGHLMRRGARAHPAARAIFDPPLLRRWGGQ